MKKILAGAAAAAVLLAGCGSSDDGAPASGGSGLTTVKVAGATTIEPSLPYIVAEAKGYFRDEGLKIEQTELRSGQSAVALVSTGKIDVALGGASAGMFSALDQGLKFKYVADLSRTSGGLPSNAQLLLSAEVMASGDVQSVGDLKGRKFAIAGGAGALASAYLATILKDGGLTVKDVKIVDTAFPDMETALKNGTVDGAISAEPFLSKIVADKVAEPFAAVKAGLPSIILLLGEDFVGGPAAQKFVNAIVRAEKDLQTDGGKSQESIDILAKASGQDASVLKGLMFSTYPSPPLPSASIDEIQQLFLDAGLLTYDEPIDASTFVDDSLVEKADVS